MLALAVILYYVSIRDFLNPRQMNYDPWSYVISIGLGYLCHILSSKFVIDIALLSLYYVISNHPVTGSIIIPNFRCKFYFCIFLPIIWDNIRSTNSLFHGISSANLAGNLPYFLFDNFVRWQVSQLVI